MGGPQDLAGRIAALGSPRRTVDSYGNCACGCTWDSGPFDVPCVAHDFEGVAEAVHAELLRAAREALESGVVEGLREAVGLADALRAVPDLET